MQNNHIEALKNIDNLLEFNPGENLTCYRFLDYKKERFELEFNLERGTSHNTFLINEDNELIIIHPPELEHFESFKKIISS